MTDAYYNSDYADFDSSEEIVTQLPSLPVDEVLPKVNNEIEKKQVKFKEPPDEYSQPEANVILPKEDSKQTQDNKLFDLVVEYIPYILAILLVVIAIYYNKYY